MVNPIPEGYPRVTPYLICDGASDAIEFYSSVLGAKERMRMGGPDGKVGHAELEIGNSKTTGGTPVSLHVYVEDVDGVFQQALDAGATERQALENKFYGDRSGSFEDPFGHVWHVASHVEDVPPDEMEKRAAAAAAG
jgi:PhnB protein